MKKYALVAVVFSAAILSKVVVSAPVKAQEWQTVIEIPETIELVEETIVEEPHITYIENTKNYIPESARLEKKAVQKTEKKDKKKKKTKKNKEEPVKDEAKVVAEYTNMDYNDLELLAHCVQAEAGNQDLYGKQLVVDVILNRVDSDEFPNSIEGVITQRRQFSVWSNGSIHRVTPDSETYESIRTELEERTDNTIIFFTAGKYNPCGTPAYKYGDHYFSTL